MLGRVWRRSASAAVVTLVAAAAVSAPSPAAAESVGEGAVLGSLGGSASTAISHWTGPRRRAAEPFSVLTLSGSPTGTAAAADTLAATSTIKGVDTGESTLFPNRANGTVYGVYRIGGEREEYQCSGSVIDSPQGDVVLTAGHCVIDPETGTVASAVVFVPGYREGAAPYGVWSAATYATTEAWKTTAGTSRPDEAGDLALLAMRDNSEGKSVEETVGSLSIAFDQSRLQTYTEWGYPGEAPYKGEVLYSNTATYAGSDTSFSPAPIRIASDFTGGSSGGPWTIGSSSAPTVVSLTDYVYERDPGYIYGAYLGEAARNAYELASGAVVPAGTESAPETGAESPAATEPSTAPAGGTQVSVPEGTGQSSSAAGATSTAAPSVRIVGLHHNRAAGSAVLLVKVGGPGTLSLTGSSVRTDSLTVTGAGTYRLNVIAKGSAARQMKLSGSATVGLTIAFSAAGQTRRAARSIRLIS
jgi:V8-like Glu-specific endopeptidase